MHKQGRGVERDLPKRWGGGVLGTTIFGSGLLELCVSSLMAMVCPLRDDSDETRSNNSELAVLNNMESLLLSPDIKREKKTANNCER